MACIKWPTFRNDEKLVKILENTWLTCSKPLFILSSWCVFLNLSQSIHQMLFRSCKVNLYRKPLIGVCNLKTKWVNIQFTADQVGVHSLFSCKMALGNAIKKVQLIFGGKILTWEVTHGQERESSCPIGISMSSTWKTRLCSWIKTFDIEHSKTYR